MKNSNRGPVAVTISAGFYAENCAPAANEVCVGNFHSLDNSLVIIHSLLFIIH